MDSDFNMRKIFYEESVKESKKKFKKKAPKSIDRFLEHWWPEFQETASEFGFSKEYIKGLNPEDFRIYYNNGYSPQSTFMMELHWI